MTAEEWARKVADIDRPTAAKILIDAGAMRMRDLNALLAEPTHYQPIGGQKLLHDAAFVTLPGGGSARVKIKIGAGGWRGGKSRWLAREGTHPIVTVDKCRVWILGADYDLGREEFQYVLDDINALGYPTYDRSDLSTPKQGKWSLQLSNGSLIETQTAEDLRKIEAANLIKILLVEAGSLTLDLLTAAEGRVLEAWSKGIGGEVCASGRHRGSHNWYTDLWRLGQGPNARQVVSASMHSWDNLAVYPPCDPATCTLETVWPPPPQQERFKHGGFHSPAIQYYLSSKSEDEFGEHIAAEPRPDRSLVLADWWDRDVHMVPMEFEGRKDAVAVVDAGRKLIGWRLPIEAPVELWIDPGHRGAYAVLARQKHGDDIVVIDEIYVKGQNTSAVIEIIKGKWYFPYVKSAVIDIATKWETESWYQKEINVWPRGQKVLVSDGIERVRTFLRDPATKRPRIWFNKGPEGGSCPFTMSEAEQGWRYHTARSDVDPRGDKEEPIDVNNHAWNAIGYGLLDNFGRSALYEESASGSLPELGYDGKAFRR